MTDVIGQEINKQLNELRLTIESYNRKANITGLFSQHVLRNVKEFKVEWGVLCDELWVIDSFQDKNAYSLSALGYSLYYCLKMEDTPKEKFVSAFDRLSQRNLFKGAPVSFVYQPATMLGLVLGVKSIEDHNWRVKASEWLAEVIEKRIEEKEISGYQFLIYSFVKQQLTGHAQEIKDVSRYTAIEELAILEYSLQRNIINTPNRGEAIETTRKELISLLVKSDVRKYVDEKAAFIWAASNETITAESSKLLLSTSFVSAILSRFEDAMKRWRYDSDEKKDPIKWPVTREREVQDILWLILRSYFEDLVDEQALPKFGHKFYKPDFAIPSLGLLIEVKFVSKKDEFKNIEQEIMTDTIGYLSKTDEYESILIFIYDKSGSVQEHGETKRDLSHLKEIEDVIIVSKPSQLPS